MPMLVSKNKKSLSFSLYRHLSNENYLRGKQRAACLQC